MYIPSSPHLLAHFNPGPIPPLDVLQALPPTPPNPQDKPHPAGYVALAVVISILLLLLVAFFTIRHRVAAVLLCTARRAKKDNKSVTSPRMQREGCSSFLGGFDLVPASSVRTGSRSGSGASCIPSSPNSSSEGPSTPSLGEHEHEHGDLGLGHTGKNSNDGSAIVPTIVVHAPSQTRHIAYFPGPDVLSPDFASAASPHVHFFNDAPAMSMLGSAIRPHGLPLSPVPEESSSVPTLSSIYFDLDGTLHPACQAR